MFVCHTKFQSGRKLINNFNLLKVPSPAPPNDTEGEGGGT